MKMLSVSAYISFLYCLGNIALFPKYCPGNLGNKISALFSQKHLTKMRGAWYNKISARGGPFARRPVHGYRCAKKRVQKKVPFRVLIRRL